MNIGREGPSVACRKGLNLSIPDQSLDLPFVALQKMSRSGIFLTNKATGRLMSGGCSRERFRSLV
jgi:hypothetical protein